MKEEIVNPTLSNFIKSLRDIGYSFEIAVADILDNSISAKSTIIDIHFHNDPEVFFSVLDNGIGMDEAELVEAMRLSSKDPESHRETSDLGRFSLGLKTASFSQCTRLNVLSKKNGKINIKCWDLDLLAKTNQWILLTPEKEELKFQEQIDSLDQNESGTLIVWEKMDRLNDDVIEHIHNLRQHLALVFHRFIEGLPGKKKLELKLNNNPIIPFNPFNDNHPATYQRSSEYLRVYDSEIKVTPYILPHHNKLSSNEWSKFETRDGYIKSQGFYLYRENRLLIHGTWWGMQKFTDAHKLIRIKIDIPNDQDEIWGIDIKKSKAKPDLKIRKELKRIVEDVISEGVKPFHNRGRRIKDKTENRFWDLVTSNNGDRFAINKEHPLYLQLSQQLPESSMFLLDSFIKGVESFLPVDAIQAKMQENPFQLTTNSQVFDEEEKLQLISLLEEKGYSNEILEMLKKSEGFK